VHKKSALLALVALLVALPALAGNGHFLHGIGAVDSSLGGVATALPADLLGALHVNPAVLTSFEGYEVAFGAEVFGDGPRATATFHNSPAHSDGTFTTKGNTQAGVIPAIGILYHPKDRPWAVGFGLLGVAGFRTDWPQDPSNPIFAPQPNGFGAVKTNLTITKIPFSFAYQVNPGLALGASLNVYQGGLSISPLPPGRPDCTYPTPGSGRTVDCFYAPAENVVSAYALSLQVGLRYQFAEAWHLGLAYTSPQNFPDYEWNSFNALPYLTDSVTGAQTRNPDYGVKRKVRYPLDGPQIASFGLSYEPHARWRAGFDARWIGYSSVDGAGGPGGFKPDRSLNGIGWRNIWVGAVGVEYKATNAVTLRAGFNYGQSPIRSEVAFTSLGTPPTFTDHYCLGVGVDVTDKLQVNLAAYYAPRHEVSGPLLNAFLVGGPNGPGPQSLAQEKVPGGKFTISEQIVSALAAVRFHF